jgi:hypothetical protein
MADLYLTSGFLALQDAVHRAYLEVVGGNASALPHVLALAMPMPEWTEDNSKSIRPVAVMFVIMAFSPLIQYLCIAVVSEKERGIKEAMYLMGMRPLSYWASWVLTYALLTLFPVLALVAIGCTVGAFSNSNALCVFFVLYTFAMSLVSLALVATPFFKSSKVAGMAGSLSTTIFSLIIFGLKSTNSSVRWGVSIFAPCAAALTIESALVLDSEGGMTFKNFGSGNFSVADGVFLYVHASCGICGNRLFQEDQCGLAVKKSRPLCLARLPCLTCIPKTRLIPTHASIFTAPHLISLPSVPGCSEIPCYTFSLHGTSTPLCPAMARLAP